jgi:hypothetical protein
MSTLTAPGNPGGSNSRAGGRKHAIASVAGGTALVAVVLGAAACAAPPAGGSRPVSLSGPSGAAAPSVLVPGTPAAVTSVPGAPKARAVTPARPSQPGAASPPAPGAARSPGYSAPAVATSSPASAAGPAPSAGSASTGSASTGSASTGSPAAGSAPPAAPGSAAPTLSAPSQPASAGSGGALSVSRGCAAQLTVLEDQAMSPCSFTKSGGNPEYLYSVNLYVNGNLSLAAGSAPDGLTFTDTNNDTVFTIGGKPTTPGTYNLTVEFYAGTDKASASVTLVVSQDPNLPRLP